jgi:hypothetical protein
MVMSDEANAKVALDLKNTRARIPDSPPPGCLSNLAEFAAWVRVNLCAERSLARGGGCERGANLI